MSDQSPGPAHEEAGQDGCDHRTADLLAFVEQLMKRRKRKTSLRPGAVVEFVRLAKRRTEKLLGQTNVRATDSNSELVAFYRGIREANQHLKSAGKRGREHILAAAMLCPSGSTDDDFGHDGLRFLQELAGVAAEAIEELEAAARELPERKGGPTPDYGLQDLALALAQDYQRLFGLRPGHARNDTSPSWFDQIFARVLEAFAPVDFHFRQHSIAAAIKRATEGLRNLERDRAIEEEIKLTSFG